MTMEITADQMFAGGHRAPRGTYLCTSTGVVHRLSRPTTLPLGGPFRLVAPTMTLGPVEAIVFATTPASPSEYRWPEEADAPEPAPKPAWFDYLAAYRVARMNAWW